MKKLVSFLILATSLISLTACAAKDDDNNVAQNDNNESGDASQMTYSQYFAKSKQKPQIWYEVYGKSGIGKDSTINAVLIVKNNKAFYYEFAPQSENRLKLGEVSKMKDAEIISKITKFYNDDQSEELKYKLETMNDGFDRYSQTRENVSPEYAALSKRIADYYKNAIDVVEKTKPLKPHYSKLNLSVITDQSGNKTETERISFKTYQRNMPDTFGDVDVDADEIINEAISDFKDKGTSAIEDNYDYDLDISVLRGTEVYDSRYITCYVKTDKDWKQPFLLTRNDKLPALIYDEPNAKNVEVDPDN